MQVAEVLSDLTSLRVCDPKAAIALVSARPVCDTRAPAQQTTKHEDSDPDLKRAKDLVELHGAVKFAQDQGTERELRDARAAVISVLKDL
ncbi:hypothetical protein M433DRAFT_159 [Acidomyces richmondensis BFW]|nr:MAG: hypothetical protein FE78DRAFT_156574 [Acidomyces sp. 'richmondensis']KYG50495.1 hypothetical protein M433DRAFT_159 [Acidomyces richmondensis BFW]